MKQALYEITSNRRIADSVYEIKLNGDLSEIRTPGQFVNLRIDGLYLRRPISVCDVSGDCLTLIYKAVGKGTCMLSRMTVGQTVDVLSGLGNGYDLSVSGIWPLLIGGGAGVPPLFWLAKKLVEDGNTVTAVLGFNSAADVFYEEEFGNLGVETRITTVDGSYGIKGFVTDALPEFYTHFYACGPEPMLKAVYDKTFTSGQFSFEERMGCGFGACMGCSCRTVTGFKRICKDGPVLKKEEILWKQK
ncbi:MAG: dihydroorotate dehydrogenase electron transfer subunit [Clostridia bacterium]|nr:dihydroorotate dehydrogenase electron transfer subunit [Clostridia bacterium]